MSICNEITGFPVSSLTAAGEAPAPETLDAVLGHVGLPGRWALAGRIVMRDAALDVNESLRDIVRRCIARPPADPRLTPREHRGGGGR
ncbi:MAG: hypothetical protein MJ061_07195 [Mailhella sp.]|nr:hypothetical protein [Mailhella sp.]